MTTDTTENSKASIWDRMFDHGLPGSTFDPGAMLYAENPEGFHLGMDIMGLLPGVGEYFDVFNAGLYAVEGDYGNAALTGLSAIPIAGWIPAAGKLGNKAFKFGFKGSTKAAEKGADDGVREAVEDAAKAGGKCSFAGNTPVLLENETKKSISQIEIGDRVRAKDPGTGESGARTVTHVWVHRDTVVDLRVEDGVISTTEDHPFWNASDQRFARADSLDSGDKLLADDGRLLRVVGIVPGSQRVSLACNLTVDDLHTYFVAAGASTVLVHNTGCIPVCVFLTDPSQYFGWCR